MYRHVPLAFWQFIGPFFPRPKYRVFTASRDRVKFDSFGKRAEKRRPFLVFPQDSKSAVLRHPANDPDKAHVSGSHLAVGFWGFGNGVWDH